MGHRSHGAPEFEKYQLFYRPSGTPPPTIVSANGREHSILRRQLSRGFSEHSLRQQQPLIMRYVDLLVQRLHENCKSGAVDMMAWYNFMTFEFIGDLAFGEPFGCLEKLEYHPWIRGIFMSARLGTVVQIVNHYPFLKSILFYLLATKSTKEAKGRNLMRAKEKLGRRIEVGAKEGGRPDLIGGLLNKKDKLTTVAIHRWAINRNEAFSKNPFGLHPERFLGDPEYASGNREALQPFHVGPRNCLGRNLAYVEMRLILARLICNFDLELADESRAWVARQKVFILWDKGPLMVHLTPVRR